MKEEGGSFVNHPFSQMRKLTLREMKQLLSPGRSPEFEAMPLWLGGVTIASRLLVARIASRSDLAFLALSSSSVSKEWEDWEWIQAAAVMRSFLPDLWEGPVAPPLWAHTCKEEGRLLSFLSCSQKDFWPWFLGFFSSPIHPQGASPSPRAHPSSPPHAHHGAMAARQTRAPFFKVVRLHLINSQPRLDWLHERELGPHSAPQIQSELCAVCPREVNHRGPRLSEIPKDKIPKSLVTGSKLSMARQRKADSWENQDNEEAVWTRSLIPNLRTWKMLNPFPLPNLFSFQPNRVYPQMKTVPKPWGNGLKFNHSWCFLLPLSRTCISHRAWFQCFQFLGTKISPTVSSNSVDTTQLVQMSLSSISGWIFAYYRLPILSSVLGGR